jgi:hypothetical protein
MFQSTGLAFMVEVEEEGGTCQNVGHGRNFVVMEVELFSLIF